MYLFHCMRLTSKTPLPKQGAISNRDSRFLRQTHSDEGSQLEAWDELPPPPNVEIREEIAKSIISYNQSPDIPFDRSINLARGCQHGCIYCYARPIHAYLGLSAGLDFETKLFIKPNAAELLRKELSRPGYRPAPLALGANTDPYQPYERQQGLTRQILKVLAEFKHPVLITSKGSLIERDMDLLGEMAAQNLVRVAISIATLEPEIARRLEPQAASPKKRLELIRRLNTAGIPTGVIVAPIIPALTDQDLEKVLLAAQSAGAQTASYIFLRLPLEIRDLFVEWLHTHYPDRAEHVMSLVRQSRGGKDYNSDFGQRLRGQGIFADLIRQRFNAAYRRLGFRGDQPLNLNSFVQAKPRSTQLDLFD